MWTTPLSSLEPSLKKRWPWLLLAALAAAQLLCAPGRYLGFEHDDVLYVLASRSILAGRYALGIFPGDPWLTEMTPGWPVLLAPAAVLSGDSPLGYQLWSWAWLVAASGLLLAWLRRRLPDGPAAAATALFALNPLVLSRSGIVMSEAPFLAGLLALLLALESGRSLRGREAGLALGFLWLVRPGAAAVFPAVFAFYLMRRRGRDFFECGAVSASALMLWKLYVGWAGGGLAETRELAMAWPDAAVRGFASVPLWNLSSALSLLGRTLLPWRAASGSAIALAVGTTAALVSAAGWLVRLRPGRYETAAGYLAGGVLLHAVWPWWYERYLLSFLPFLIWGGCEVLRSRMSAGTLAWGLAAAALLPLPSQGPALIAAASAAHRPELAETYAWIRQNTPEGAMWTSAFYATDAFYTGRPFRPLPAGSEEGFQGSGADFVLWREIPDLGSSLRERFYWSRHLLGLEESLRSGNLESIYSNIAEQSAAYKVPPA